MKIKNQINTIITKYGQYLGIFIYLGIMFVLDTSLKYSYSSYSMTSFTDSLAWLFLGGWIFLHCTVILLLPKRGKQIFIICNCIIYMLLCLVHATYINVFNKFFSFSDLSLLSEGVKFVDSSYIQIRSRFYILTLLVIFFMCVSSYLIGRGNNDKKPRFIISVVAAITSICCFVGAHNAFPPLEGASWNSKVTITEVYDRFVDTTKNLLGVGFYQYTFQDLNRLINPIYDMKEDQTAQEIEQYVSEFGHQHTENENTGLFAGKNVIMVQLENIDNWMITEQNMPHLYAIQDQSMDFTNFYSVNFATGRTFNTEFTVLTGLIPPMKGEAPSSIFVENAYPYAFPNLLKSNGYTVNSYHPSNPGIYNRGAAHEQFGFENYYNYEAMGMDNYLMDSQMLNNYEIMQHDEPFYNFLITISGHGPFDIEQEACSAHIDEVRSENDDPYEMYLYGLAQAKETDLLIGNLLQNLESDGTLQDTVLIFYADHYAYSTISADYEQKLKGTTDANLLQNTPFFIWSADMEGEKIDTLCSTEDVLPTLINLMGIEFPYEYFIGEDIFSTSSASDDSYVFFSDYSWIDTEEYWTVNSGDNEKSNMRSREINNILDYSWSVLGTDYFASHSVSDSAADSAADSNSSNK